MIFCDYARLLTESYNNDKYEDRIVYWFHQYRDARRMAMIKNRLESAKVVGHVFDLRRPFAIPDNRWTHQQYIDHEKASEIIFNKESEDFDKRHKAILAKYRIPEIVVEGVYNTPTNNREYEIEYEDLVKGYMSNTSNMTTHIRSDMVKRAIPIGIQANGRIRCLYRDLYEHLPFRIVLNDSSKDGANLIVSAFVDSNLRAPTNTKLYKNR